jgi:hypothetical protein
VADHCGAMIPFFFVHFPPMTSQFFGQGFASGGHCGASGGEDATSFEVVAAGAGTEEEVASGVLALGPGCSPPPQAM